MQPLFEKNTPLTSSQSAFLEVCTKDLTHDGAQHDLAQRISQAQMQFLHTLCSNTSAQDLLAAAQELQKITTLDPASTKLPLAKQHPWSTFAMAYQGIERVRQLKEVMHWVSGSAFTEPLEHFLQFYAQEHQAKKNPKSEPQAPKSILPDLPLYPLKKQELVLFCLAHKNWFDDLLQFAYARKPQDPSMQARTQKAVLHYLCTQEHLDAAHPHFFWSSWYQRAGTTKVSYAISSNYPAALFGFVKQIDFDAQGIAKDIPLERFEKKTPALDAFFAMLQSKEQQIRLQLQALSDPNALPPKDLEQKIAQHKEVIAQAVHHLHRVFLQQEPHLEQHTAWADHTLVGKPSLTLATLLKPPKEAPPISDKLTKVPLAFLKAHVPSDMLDFIDTLSEANDQEPKKDPIDPDLFVLDSVRAPLLIEPFLPARLHSSSLQILEKTLPYDPFIAFIRAHHPTDAKEQESLSLLPRKTLSTNIKQNLFKTLQDLHAKETLTPDLHPPIAAFIQDITGRFESSSHFFPILYQLQTQVHSLQKECVGSILKRLTGTTLMHTHPQCALRWSLKKLEVFAQHVQDLAHKTQNLLEQTGLPFVVQQFCLQSIFTPHVVPLEVPWKKSQAFERNEEAKQFLGSLASCAYLITLLQSGCKDAIVDAADVRNNTNTLLKQLLGAPLGQAPLFEALDGLSFKMSSTSDVLTSFGKLLPEALAQNTEAADALKESYFYQKNAAFSPFINGASRRQEPLKELYFLAAQEHLHFIKKHVGKDGVRAQAEGVLQDPFSKISQTLQNVLSGRSMRVYFLSAFFSQKNKKDLTDHPDFSIIAKNAVQFVIREQSTPDLHLFFCKEGSSGFFQYYPYLQKLYAEQNPSDMISFWAQNPLKRDLLKRFFTKMHLSESVQEDLLHRTPQALKQALCDHFSTPISSFEHLLFTRPSLAMLNTLAAIDTLATLRAGALWRACTAAKSPNEHSDKMHLHIEQLELEYIAKKAPVRSSGALRL